jgi:hypothetical protein
MDSKLFRLPTSPDLFKDVQQARPADIGRIGKSQQLPAPDIRFPGWAGPMADARLVTDYSSHCSGNIPTGRQYATKQWMQKNAVDIITLSRQRQANYTGAIYPFDTSVEPPPVAELTCQPDSCKMVYTRIPGGIGVARHDVVPDLFGTFQEISPTLPPRPRVAYTTEYEGGRNTPRG